MSDYFSRQGVDDIIRSIISSWPLEEIQELQLVNRTWRQMIASPDFGYQILGKDAIFMVSHDAFYVVHLQSLLRYEDGDRVVYNQRWFPGIRLPLVSIIGTCDGLIFVRDSKYGLFVLNPRNLKYRRVVGSSLIYRAYGIGWKHGGCSTRFHVVVVLDLIARKIRILNLKTNEWSHQNVVYGNSDWKIEAISQDEGVFVNGVFAWLGRGIRDNRIFHSILLYDGKRELFDSMELPESLNRPGLVLRSLADDIVGLWERETKDCIWLWDFEGRLFQKIKINGYSGSGADFEPLYFSDSERTSLLLLVNRKRLDLYGVENDKIQRQFPDLPTARFTTKMIHFKAIRFRDTFESPGEEMGQKAEGAEAVSTRQEAVCQ